ncbi:cytochrome P450 [Punctularia strigosozonata HHB-11173 SS5]|uniref:cytochrome P450 n=1 Tax=Punctularia strigosozonata (strain HHB-11173) TaxID=741275 RepID=UPI0004417DA0|nr:cytochrome P450 [Punctularia strigosozonata HHB-11173 SS5]EIN05410.1 cytochrome P450 [Punctularia strigosozonata HHB-11173 SS5]
MDLTLLFVASLCSAFVAIWRLYSRSATKCAIKKLPGPPSPSFVTGHMKKLFSPWALDYHLMLPRIYGSAVRINGLIGDEQIYITDPRALHHVLVKDGQLFEETSGFVAQNRAIFGPGLLSTHGEAHRKQRKLLNPVFSLAHMRGLASISHEIAEQLADRLMTRTQDGSKKIDMLQWMSRTSLEHIGVGGLGYTFQALDEEVENEYANATRSLLPVLFPLLPYRMLLVFLIQVLPTRLQRFLAAKVPSKRIAKIRDVVAIMDRTSKDIFTHKKHALSAGEEMASTQTGRGKDIMSILLNANMNVSKKEQLDEEELLAQMNTLLFAGHESTGNALARILWCLSLHLEEQEKLRREITDARRTHGKLDYDKLVTLPYLDAVCRETLRVWAPTTVIQRTARADVVLPLMFPVTLTNGQIITELPVRENQTVIIGIAAVNRSQIIWGTDADEWRPERWLEPLPDSVVNAKIPGVYSHL